MITRNPPVGQSRETACLRHPEALWRRLQLPPQALPGAQAAARDFPLRLPERLLARIPPQRPDDPLLHQFLPRGEELAPQPGYLTDPLQETAASAATPGLLRKYRNRALAIVTGTCPVHCRYCFRRHFPYAKATLDGPTLRRLLADGAPVEELILSGGDPLMLSPRRLQALTDALEGLEGLRLLRVHSRVPVLLPERIDEAMVAWWRGLARQGLQPVLVIHANHPRELDDAAAEALARLGAAGVVRLNQSVLLKGVNDHPDTLAQLSRRLLECGVLPYYLHLLDPVRGAAHFHVPEDRARELLHRLRTQLPGYLVPRLVRETPGAPYKIPIS